VNDEQPTDAEIVVAVEALLDSFKPGAPVIEQDDRDSEARWLLHRYYQDTWALARARNNPSRRTP
jgi:hypothetical protein